MGYYWAQKHKNFRKSIHKIFAKFYYVMSIIQKEVKVYFQDNFDYAKITSLWTFSGAKFTLLISCFIALFVLID